MIIVHITILVLSFIAEVAPQPIFILHYLMGNYFIRTVSENKIIFIFTNSSPSDFTFYW